MNTNLLTWHAARRITFMDVWCWCMSYNASSARRAIWFFSRYIGGGENLHVIEYTGARGARTSTSEVRQFRYTPSRSYTRTKSLSQTAVHWYNHILLFILLYQPRCEKYDKMVNNQNRMLQYSNVNSYSIFARI